jgi:hypothetical protein
MPPSPSPRPPWATLLSFAAVSGAGLAFASANLSHVAVTVAASFVEVDNVSVASYYAVYGVGAAIYATNADADTTVAVARRSTVVVRDCTRTSSLAVGGVGVVQAGGSFAAIYVNVTDSSVVLRGGATFNGVGGVGVFEYLNVAAGLRAVSVNVTRSVVSVANVSNGGSFVAVRGIGIAGSNTANNVSYTVSGDASNVTIAGVLSLSPTCATVGAVGIAGLSAVFASARINVVNCNLYARDVGNPIFSKSIGLSGCVPWRCPIQR